MPPLAAPLHLPEAVANLRLLRAVAPTVLPLFVPAHHDAVPSGALHATASVLASQYDPDPDNNTASALATLPYPVGGAADLTVTTDLPATAPLGWVFEFSVFLTNNGPEGATNVLARFAFPRALQVKDPVLYPNNVLTVETTVRPP